MCKPGDLVFSAGSGARSDIEKAPLPPSGRQHVLMKTVNVPNLQNTIQKGTTEVNMQLYSVFNLLRLDNRSLHNRK